MTWSSPGPGLALVGTTLIVGAYLVAVVDVATFRLVAGQRRGIGSVALHPLRQAALLLGTRGTTTERPDARAWALAPALLGAMAAVGVASVPLSRGVAAADVDDGIVLFGAAMAIVMVAVYLHGWSANSPFPLVGGYRFIALSLSYEMPLALVLIAAALPAESLSIGAIVESQAGLWNIVRQPLGLPLYLVAAAGLAFWGPLQLPDSPDLAGGSLAEAAGPARLAWLVARAGVLVAVSLAGSAVFLGGWHGPVLPDVLWTVVKAVALGSLIITVGHLTARVRLERFVVVSWAVLIPLALVDVFVSGALAL